MISLLKNYWRCWLAALAGFWLAMLISNLHIESLKNDYLNEKLALNQIHTELIKQSTATNEQLSIALFNKQNELTSIKQQLERSINDAIKNDGVSYNGIGTDSLRLYKCALGYCRKSNTTGTHDQATDKTITTEVGKP